MNRKLILLIVVLFSSISFKVENFPMAKATDATHPVTMTTSVLEYIDLDISGPAADTIAFGNLTPGTPICFATGAVATVNTNAANGYTLGIDDNTAVNSSMHQGAVYIPKMTNGTIASPVVWDSNFGVGIGLYAADTTKEVKWGDGDDVCVPTGELVNKYAAIPQTATTAHTAAGGPKTADTSSWSYKIDVENTQQTGVYSGTMTFTATAVLP